VCQTSWSWLDGALGRGALSTTADSHSPGNAVRGILLLDRKQLCMSTNSRIKCVHTYIISLSQVTMVLRNRAMEHINLHGKYF
jgi:hypothetical protein